MTSEERIDDPVTAIDVVRSAFPKLASEKLRATAFDLAPGFWIVSPEHGGSPNAGGVRYFVDRSSGRIARTPGSLPPSRAYAHALEQLSSAATGVSAR